MYLKVYDMKITDYMKVLQHDMHFVGLQKNRTYACLYG